MRSPNPRGITAGPEAAGVTALVESLELSTHGFTDRDRVLKRRALADLAGLRIRGSALLLRFHEAVSFLRVHPDDRLVLKAAQDALAGVAARVSTLHPPGALDETGVAGTAVYLPASYPMARWLSGRFSGLVELDWEDAETAERLGVLLPLLSGLANEETLVEVGVDYRDWLAALKGTDARSDLAWLLDRVGRDPARLEVRQLVYSRLGLRVRWQLGETPASRTLLALPVAAPFFHTGPLLRWRGALIRRLPGPRVTVRQAARPHATRLLDTARAAVLTRYREVHAFNHGNPQDVLVAEVGRGVQIAWLGVMPRHRLPIRAHYGYLLLKNGVPVGYGDASLLFDWVEIAYNVFETFRHGESAFIFVRLIAFLHQHFGIRAIHVSPYQIGRGNDEAIRSGAFWFYYKLGFRPTRGEPRRLAADECRRIRASPGYRSSSEVLEHLSRGGMFLNAGARDPGAVRDFEIRRLTLRAAAQRDPARETGRRGWDERTAHDAWAAVLGLVPDLAAWSPRERRTVVQIVRAKGGRRETEYLRHLRAHGRLRAALLALGGPGPAGCYSAPSSSRRSSSRPK